MEDVEPWMSGNARGPSSAFNLLYRLCQLRPDVRDVRTMLDHPDSPYIRAVRWVRLCAVCAVGGGEGVVWGGEGVVCEGCGTAAASLQCVAPPITPHRTLLCTPPAHPLSTTPRHPPLLPACLPACATQIGFLYLRYVCDPRRLWDWYKDYLHDSQVCRVGRWGVRGA